MEMDEAFDEFISQEKLHSTYGTTGVKNLARICRAIGYHDKTYFGQFEGASYGDLINFLEDNQGAVEAILDFIREGGVDEWKENLISRLDEKRQNP